MSKFFVRDENETIPTFIIERLKRIENVFAFLFDLIVHTILKKIIHVYVVLLKTNTRIKRRAMRIRWYIARRLEGYRFIKGQQFLDMFQPNTSCSGKNGCHGKGFYEKAVGTGEKRILWCHCVLKQYSKHLHEGGQKYEVYDLPW
jgi:hypothetical protein